MLKHFMKTMVDFVRLPKLGPLGIVQHYQRFRGTIRQEMNLNEFPFDHHIMEISFAVYSCSDKFSNFVNITDQEYKKVNTRLTSILL